MDQAENAPVFGRWINNMWNNKLEPYYQIIKKGFIIFVIVFNICCVSLCVSAFLFGTIYFYHMPTIQHTFPLHFHFNRSCMQQHKIVEKSYRWDRHLSTAYTKDCFPVAHVDISYPTNAMLLHEGQSYSVLIKLELPETPENLNMGMFMVNMEVNGASSNTIDVGEYRWSKRRGVKEIEKPITLSSSKSMTMRYKSPLLRYGFTFLFWPLLMFDFIHESQVLDEMLFQNLMLDQKSYNWTASIYLENPSIEVYSANIDVVAQFSGIQYLLYRWPVVSFVFGTLIFFVPTFFICAVLFYVFVWKLFFGAVPENEDNFHRNAPRRRPENRPPPPVEVPPVEYIPTPQEDAGNEPEPNPAPEPVIELEPEGRVSSTSSINRQTSLNRPEATSFQPSSTTGNMPSMSCSVRSTETQFSMPSTSEFADVSFPVPPVGRLSRRSSSSSSIEMISPPSTFSNLDDEDIEPDDTQSIPTRIDHPPTEEPNDDGGESEEHGVRRRFVE